jgi:phosphatidylglycerol:prolipoprotein diacylglycerol transferase
VQADPLLAHLAFEIAAYAVGTRLFLRERRRLDLPALADGERNLWLFAAVVLGAAIGSKLAYWLEDPVQAFAAFPDLRHLLQGKSIVGGLLGGLAGIEIGKRLTGVERSTGDAFVLPLCVGMCIGRIGCFLAGLPDHTYGLPTALPWGVDFGDGIPRHPTQLYEIAFLLAWTTLVWKRRPHYTREGDAFRLYLAGYLLFRLLIEQIKPAPMLYWPGLSGIQWLCLAGLAYYARHLPRLGRELAWDTS